MTLHEEIKQSVYLGDGVYAKRSQSGGMVLYTSNGMSITNTIYLEPEVMDELIDFWEHREEEEADSDD